MWFCVVVVDMPTTYMHAHTHTRIHTHMYTHTQNPPEIALTAGGAPGFYIFLLLVSFFWTLQVVGGVLNCTVAGTSIVRFACLGFLWVGNFV